MTPNDLRLWAERHGYARDAWGNWKKTRPTGAVVRIKMKKLAVRFERRVVVDKLTAWLPDLTAYYTELAIGEGDRIVKRRRA